MFAVIGTEVRRLGRTTSWTDLLAAIAITAITVTSLAFFVASVKEVFPQRSRDTVAPVAAFAPAVVKTASTPVLVPIEVPMAPISEPVAKWPQTEVQWGKAFYHEPGSPTVPYSREQNFYYGGMPSSPTPEQNEYCFKILRSYEFAGKDGVSCMVAAAHDPNNVSVIFASLLVIDNSATIPAMRTGQKLTADMTKFMPYLFLSMDGEKTWIEVNRPFLTIPTFPANVIASPQVAVEQKGNVVYLFARDNTVAPMIFPAILEID